MVYIQTRGFFVRPTAYFNTGQALNQKMAIVIRPLEYLGVLHSLVWVSQAEFDRFLSQACPLASKAARLLLVGSDEAHSTLSAIKKVNRPVGPRIHLCEECSVLGVEAVRKRAKLLRCNKCSCARWWTVLAFVYGWTRDRLLFCRYMSCNRLIDVLT
jgi:hypothetical protein